MNAGSIPSFRTVLPAEDQVLDFAGAAAALNELGVRVSGASGVDRPVDAERVRSWADHGKLPFFKGPDGKRRIYRSELLKAWAEPQQRALAERRQEMQQRERAPRRGARNRSKGAPA